MKVVHKTRHVLAVEEIGRRIIAGDYPSGQLPIESHLADELGISRNVLREAIKVLESKGVVEVRPRTGTRVRARHYWNMLDPIVLSWHAHSPDRARYAFDLAEFRLVVEPQSAALAAKRATKAEVRVIKEALDALVECEVPDAIPAIDLRFHQSIHAASHNSVFINIGGLIASLMKVQVEISTADFAFFRKGLPLHARLWECIAAGDADGAAATSREQVLMPYRHLARHRRLSKSTLLIP